LRASNKGIEFGQFALQNSNPIAIACVHLTQAKHYWLLSILRLVEESGTDLGNIRLPMPIGLDYEDTHGFCPIENVVQDLAHEYDALGDLPCPIDTIV
jgi:hypothetical protein